jgi:hypothetical protein
MARKVVRETILLNFASFFNGMATAWAFAAVDTLYNHQWVDLLFSLLLAILSLSASIVIGLKINYDKHT